MKILEMKEIACERVALARAEWAEALLNESKARSSLFDAQAKEMLAFLGILVFSF